MEIARDGIASKKWKQIQFDNIPESILVEVLIRLPVKLVFTFKLVCKQWLSFISDPSFMRIYTSRASNSPHLQPWTFIPCIMHVDGSQDWNFSKYKLLVDIYSRDVRRTPSLYVLRCPSAGYPDRKRYKIVAISNGLVLYGLCTRTPNVFDFIANYNICNPITGKWIALPPHARPFKSVITGFVTRVENGVLTSYRVVRVEMLLRRTNVIKFEIFSSETGEWKDFNVHIDLEIRLAYPGRPTSLSGILHWITHKHKIMAYDAYDKPDSLRIIALPDDTRNNRMNNGTPSFCDVHQGRLRYFEMGDVFTRPHGFSSFSVWVLNNYSIGDWSLQHRIDSSDIQYDGVLQSQNLYLKPMYFHPFDPDIVYLGYKSIIVSYNIKTRKLKAHGVPIDIEDQNRPYWWSTFLLVTPPWPIYIPPPLEID